MICETEGKQQKTGRKYGDLKKEDRMGGHVARRGQKRNCYRLLVE
jgi:hypothetical protein